MLEGKLSNTALVKVELSHRLVSFAFKAFFMSDRSFKSIGGADVEVDVVAYEHREHRTRRGRTLDCIFIITAFGHVRRRVVSSG